MSTVFFFLNHLTLIFFLLFQQDCSGLKKENTALKPPGFSWQQAAPDPSIRAFERQAFRLENILPEGYVKDASEDYTELIQLAVSKYKEIIFPPFPLLINDNGIKVHSDQKITFLKGSELRLKPTSKGKYAIVDIRDVSNCTLINPVIKGDRDAHLGEKGEWGMGIQITSSSNILIYNPKVENCWGDGIYISGNIKRGVPENVKIVNAYCKNNRRNGISVISVNGLVLETLYSGYNNGTDPQGGIDIEPNSAGDVIRNIKLKDIRTEYNNGGGIIINLNKLYGGENKHIGIEVLNHIDYASKDGFVFACRAEKSVKGERVSGYLNVIKPVWTANSNDAVRVRLKEPGVKFSISKPSITSINGHRLSEADVKQQLKKYMGDNILFEYN